MVINMMRELTDAFFYLVSSPPSFLANFGRWCHRPPVTILYPAGRNTTDVAGAPAAAAVA